MNHPVDGHTAWLLEGLGQACGLGPLQMDEQRRVVLQLEPGDRVVLLQDLNQGHDEGLMVAVSGRCDWLAAEQAHRLLAQADFRRHRSQPVRWIWNSGRLWASLRLSCATLQPGDLERTMQHLCGAIDDGAERV